MTIRNQEHQQKPAQKSKKARGRKGSKRKASNAPRLTREQLGEQALKSALSHSGTANYDAIFDGFMAMGIAPETIKPRVNVFTFNAWIALGRVVRRGQKGVQIVSVIEDSETDSQNADATTEPRRRFKRVTVFHESQTEPLPARESSEQPKPEAPATVIPVEVMEALPTSPTRH